MEKSELTKIVEFWNNEESYFNHPTARRGQICHSVMEYAEPFPFYDCNSIKEYKPTKNFVVLIYDKDNKKMQSSKLAKEISEIEVSEDELYKVLEDDNYYTLVSVSGCVNSYLELQRTRYGY
ncbi:MAG: hypothetical protein MJZ37_05170 [Bacilli bacterium]|nr:hypothetical protein [Bacilli bacterium]